MKQQWRNNLPQKCYKAEQVRNNEAIAAAQLGIEMFTLMEQAGASVFQLVSELLPEPESMTVLCGFGNNGGDGYIVARLARVAGWSVKLIQLGEDSKVSGDAAKARDLWRQSGGTVSHIEQGIESGTVLIDAMLGSGLSGEVRGVFAEVIDEVNRIEHRLVVSVDIPSGLNADRGVVMGRAVRADATCTFVAVKQGLLTAQGPDFCGKLCFAGLGIDKAFEALVPATAESLDYRRLFAYLPRRLPSSHKGRFGHVLLVGGNKGMSGAIRMAARACLRAGAGLVSVYCHPDNIAIVAADCPEVMVGADFATLYDRADVVVFGPGAGCDEWSEALLLRLLASNKPMVIDADGLNLLAKRDLSAISGERRWVLTPHPKEAARLAGITAPEVQNERFDAAYGLAEQYGAVVLLKGVGTLVCDAKRMLINKSGNPGMATAGMGDVLSGIIGGLLAQGLSLFDAAGFGALIHGMAGDEAAKDGQRGMMATDLLPHVRSLVNGNSKTVIDER